MLISKIINNELSNKLIEKKNNKMISKVTGIFKRKSGIRTHGIHKFVYLDLANPHLKPARSPFQLTIDIMKVRFELTTGGI